MSGHIQVLSSSVWDHVSSLPPTQSFLTFPDLLWGLPGGGEGGVTEREEMSWGGRSRKRGFLSQRRCHTWAGAQGGAMDVLA